MYGTGYQFSGAILQRLYFLERTADVLRFPWLWHCHRMSRQDTYLTLNTFIKTAKLKWNTCKSISYIQGQAYPNSQIYFPAIRLAGGPNSYTGRIEVAFHGQHVTLCDYGFDMAAANVTCNMLGFRWVVSDKLCKYSYIHAGTYMSLVLINWTVNCWN